jgi:pyruvate,water dikinase
LRAYIILGVNKVWISDDEGSERFPVFTRGNVGEVFVEVASPLTWSTYGPHSWELGWRDAFYEMGVFSPEEFKPEGQCEVVGCFGGYVYINMSVTRVMAVRIPGLSVAAIDASLFGDDPNVPPYRPDPRDENAACTERVSRWLQSLFAIDPQALTENDSLHLNGVIASRPQCETLSDKQLLTYYRNLRSANRYIFKRHLLNTYGANVLTGIIAQVSQAVGAGHLTATLATAGAGVESAQQSYELWKLSRIVRASQPLIAAFEAGIPGLLDRLSVVAEPAAKNFLIGWEKFIQCWGYLGPSVWEFRSPTYRTNPEIALRMLDRLRRAPDSSSPEIRAASLAAERESAVTEIVRRLTGNSDAQAQFLAAARCAGDYFKARESSKNQCARLIEEVRVPLRELGQRLVKRGLIARWENLLLVTNDEADALVADPAAHRDLIVARATQLETLRAKEPPFVFDGDPPTLAAFKDRIAAPNVVATAGTKITGIGVSPGCYTGRARVIRSLNEDSDLEPGEVIVARTTDASWGPLFLAAGAIVVETGATISHAAIVARELGLPAAVSVAGATRRIRSGTLVTVDGSSGAVVVH